MANCVTCKARCENAGQHIVNTDCVSYVSERARTNEIRINLNEVVKVKLTDLGKDIYYHRFDELNQRCGRIVCEPSFPKEDAEGYTKFPLWHFIELYGEHMGMTMPNMIKPLEIIYKLPKEDSIDERF